MTEVGDRGAAVAERSVEAAVGRVAGEAEVAAATVVGRVPASTMSPSGCRAIA